MSVLTWAGAFFLCCFFAGTRASGLVEKPLGRVVVVFGARDGASRTAPIFSSCEPLPPEPAPARELRHSGWLVLNFFAAVVCSLTWWSLALDFLPVFLGEAIRTYAVGKSRSVLWTLCIINSLYLYVHTQHKTKTWVQCKYSTERKIDSVCACDKGRSLCTMFEPLVREWRIAHTMDVIVKTLQWRHLTVSLSRPPQRIILSDRNGVLLEL